MNYKIYGQSQAHSGTITVYDFSKGYKGKSVGKTSLADNRFEIGIDPDIPTILIELTDFTCFDYVGNSDISSHPDAVSYTHLRAHET